MIVEVELMGGPADGQKHCVDGDVDGMRVEMFVPGPQVLLQSDPARPLTVLSGWYRTSGKLCDRGKLFWQGWDE